MDEFQSKYNYIILGLRILLLLLLLSGLSLISFIGIPNFTNQNKIANAIGLFLYGLGIFGYFLYMLSRSTFKERNDIVITTGEITLRDNLFGKHIKLNENLKGYSTSNYFDRLSIYSFKTLIFYFKDGPIIEFPQFLYWNFKDIQPTLQKLSVTYLGQEPFKWKNLLSRKYFFKQKG